MRWCLPVILVAALVIHARGAEPASIGQVVSVEGAVFAIDAQQASRNLALQSKVFLNERIVTGPGASVKILLSDNSIIAQGERSEMVLDEYVYQPKEKQGNCLMRLTRGVFRVITGKITELNPKEFRVRSGLATIGIRGCEVGFRIASKDEDIYVMELPRGKSIYIERNAGGSAKKRGPAFLDITQAGVVVSIHAGDVMTRRAFAPAEVQRVFQSTDTGASGSSDTVGVKTQRRQPQQAADSLLASGSEQDKSTTLAAEAAHSTASPSSQGSGGDTRPQLPVIPQPPAVVPAPTTPPRVPPPVSSPPVLVGGNPELNTWEWGIWEDGTIQASPNQYIGAAFLSREDYASVASSATAFHLNGSGQAGATIYQAKSGGSKQVTGSVTLSVDVGGSASPTWGGSFDLGNTDGDKLAFTIDPATGGTISSDGHLVLSTEGGLSAYSVTVNGETFDRTTLTQQSVSGQLIKPSSAAGTTVSGAAGEFHFSHGKDAQIDGAFGVDF